MTSSRRDGIPAPQTKSGVNAFVRLSPKNLKIQSDAIAPGVESVGSCLTNVVHRASWNTAKYGHTPATPKLHTHALTMTSAAQTIFALASGRGRAGIAVFRISGPAVRTVLPALLPESASAVLARPRMLVPAAVSCAKRGVLDRGMAVFFPGPRSFTGEDAAEVHVHGSPAVVNAVHGALLAASPAHMRPAEAGEFVRRAFAAGKLGIAQVEALADLLAAETEAQRAMAAGAAERLGEAAGRWTAVVADALAACEAAIDFGEDEDAGGMGPVVDRRAGIHALAAELRARIAGDRVRSSVIRDGARVVLCGAPNAGKSTLFNALVGRAAAIVSSRPGTTRDVLEASIDVGGHAVVLQDTAGVRDASCDETESEGVLRALAAARSADLCLLVLSPDVQLERALLLALDPAKTIVVCSKADLGCNETFARAVLPERLSSCPMLSFSDRKDTILSAEAISRHISQAVAALADLSAPPAIWAARHASLATTALSHLECFLDLQLAEDCVVRAADELRAASHALGQLTGSVVDSEAVLDVLFSRFCVGK